MAAADNSRTWDVTKVKSRYLVAMNTALALISVNAAAAKEANRNVLVRDGSCCARPK